MREGGWLTSEVCKGMWVGNLSFHDGYGGLKPSEYYAQHTSPKFIPINVR